VLYQYHGNDMARLRTAACEVLRVAPVAPLQAQYLVVPTVGMAKWLRQGIAEQLGVAANLHTRLPAAFFDELANALLDSKPPGQQGLWSKDQICLRLMRVLPGLLEEPAFAPVQRHLQGLAPERRLFALCGRLAALFDRYLLYRPQWLLAWEREQPASDCPLTGNEWQPLLWRALVRQLASEHPGVSHGAARLQSLTAVLSSSAALACELPANVIGFGLGTLAPAFAAALNALASRTDVHLFLFNPCAEFWADIVSDRTLARWELLAPQRAALSDSGNSLLASWGNLGRAGLQQLLDYQPAQLRECFDEPCAHGVLADLQRDILDLQLPPAPRPAPQHDHSLIFAQAHSRLREVEALHDQLLDLLARLPGLRPRDITVMAPDISLYAGHINAVFTIARGDPRYLPFSIADRNDSLENPLTRSFMHLLRLPDSRFGASEIVELLGVPALSVRFGIDNENLGLVRGWILDSGVRWGLGEEQAAARNTWRFGLERMLLGMALEEGVVYRDMTPFDCGGMESMELLGRLATFIEQLAAQAQTLRAARPIAGWLPLLQGMLEDFYSEQAESAAELAELRAAITALAGLLDQAGFEEALSREVLIDMLQQRFDVREGAHQFLRGGINFCQLTPLRSIPFRVVCLLGMNADAFPRNALASAFDLMGISPRQGDPSRRDDDQYLFLEALMSARDCLYISHVARDERSNDEREAALPVNELRDYIDRHWERGNGEGSDGLASASLTRNHRLAPFHADYFTADKLFSYRHEWLAAARAGNEATSFCAEPLPPLPRDALSLGELLQFFLNPCQGFLSQRLGIHFERLEEGSEDCEPLVLDGLEGYALRSALLDAELSGRGAQSRRPALIASGVLPHGHAGDIALERQFDKIDGMRARVAEWSRLEPRSLELDLDLAQLRLRGSIGGLRGGALRQAHAASRKGRQLLRFWIHHLCCCAAGAISSNSELLTTDDSVSLRPLDPAQARHELQLLLEIHAEGMCRPQPLFVNSAWSYLKELDRSGDEKHALTRARTSFEGSERERGEAADPYIARCFPDTGSALGDEFKELSERVFRPLIAAIVEQAPA